LLKAGANIKGKDTTGKSAIKYSFEDPNSKFKVTTIYLLQEKYKKNIYAMMEALNTNMFESNHSDPKNPIPNQKNIIYNLITEFLISQSYEKASEEIQDTFQNIINERYPLLPRPKSAITFSYSSLSIDSIDSIDNQFQRLGITPPSPQEKNEGLRRRKNIRLGLEN
jgi:GR25 family glycosyltransferase involved in LPS biosynthesis